MGEKSSLKWYRLAKEDFELESYVKEFSSKGKVRLRFRLRMAGSAGLFSVVCVRMVNVSELCG